MSRVDNSIILFDLITSHVYVFPSIHWYFRYVVKFQFVSWLFHNLCDMQIIYFVIVA